MDIKVVESQHEIYQKQKLLGQGAFGKAYLVKRKADNQYLVIKEMNIDHMSQQQQKQTIKQAQILRNLNHPNIVKFVEVYVTKQNKLKIVMQYAECGDLSKAITEHKKNKKYFEQNWILDWFTQICLAIKHVHDRKILHRDIKGQNIFITKTNTLKLGDFGIARVLNKTMEKARTVVGTPYYLSPQIIQNKPYSFQSDIWSIGVVLYQLCALTHPFTANSLQFLALKIVKGSFTPIPNQYSKQLRSLVNSMLSLDPNRRPNINQIFRNPLIQDRIKNFLTTTKRNHQFSHTILHNHKVQILTNRLVQIKQQKDFEKQRLKLKQQEQLLKQKLQQKKSQDRLKKQQQNSKQTQRQKQIQRQRSQQKQRQKQKQQQYRKQLLQKQKKRKQFQRKQSILQQQKRKQQAQKKLQKEYEQKQKIAKYIEQKRKQQNQMERLRQEYDEMMYKQNQRKEEIRKAEKLKKNYQKQVQEEQKRKELQQFARKQFFENQQIMRRARQRAQQQENMYNYQPVNKQNNYQLPAQNKSKEENLPNFGKNNSSQNFHYQQKNSSKNTKPTQNLKQPIALSINKPQNKQHKQTGSTNQVEKKHQSVRDQIKKDRENFLKNKNSPQLHQQAQQVENNYQNQKKDIKTIRAAKWQRPNSRQNQNSQNQAINNKPQKYLQKPEQQEDNQNPRNNETYGSIQQKLSPSDQANFQDYLLELQNILNNINKNVDEVENKKKNMIQNQKNLNPNQVKKGSSVLAQMPEVQQVEFKQNDIIYREDDHDTLKFSLTAQFKQSDELQQVQTPKIQQSTDLDYFSDFSKLQMLRMNLQDKFGTDNFVQLYRYLQNQMQQKGLQAFSNANHMIQTASKRFSINKNTLSDSFTLLLTLIHMQSRTMGNY